MRYGPEGKPFVPPTCPAIKAGHIPDLTAIPFDLAVDPGQGRDTDVWGVFKGAEDEKGNLIVYVETALLKFSPDLPITQKLHTLDAAGVDRDDLDNPHSGLESTLNPLVERMRLAFCERVANCQGIVKGECWALGEWAVREVIGEVLENEEGV
jgi:hypothetical protein